MRRWATTRDKVYLKNEVKIFFNVNLKWSVVISICLPKGTIFFCYSPHRTTPKCTVKFTMEKMTNQILMLFLIQKNLLLTNSKWYESVLCTVYRTDTTMHVVLCLSLFCWKMVLISNVSLLIIIPFDNLIVIIGEFRTENKMACFKCFPEM